MVPLWLNNSVNFEPEMGQIYMLVDISKNINLFQNLLRQKLTNSIVYIYVWLYFQMIGVLGQYRRFYSFLENGA